MNRVRTGMAAVLSAAMLLTGCTADPAGPEPATSPTQRVIQGGAPGQPNQTLTAIPEMPDLVVEQDYTFVRHMLQHHAQAVQMTGWVPQRAEREDLQLFAERMSISQDEEIDMMQNWLREQGQPVLDLDAHHDVDPDMPGMLSQAQLDELEAAEGAQFDRLFLRYMYQHHEGALQMVEELFAADGAQDAFMLRLAKEIDSDQRIEMDRMLEMQRDMNLGDMGSRAGD